MTITVGGVLLIVVIAFAVERGLELIIELIGRLPGAIGGTARESRLEVRVVALLLGFLMGALMDPVFEFDLMNTVVGIDTDQQWILNGLIVAWSADAAHQIMMRLGAAHTTAPPASSSMMR